ncbi:USP31 protein [Cryptosporidium xiaoi]|uniref:ubiquitinyl hydrolase 1 n=1 Tax=Cryptosporidium xiaoi TaxID=659607 RepID=A0AAV9XXH6_9CRYT
MTFENNKKNTIEKRVKGNSNINEENISRSRSRSKISSECLDVSLKSLYIYNLYNPQLVLLDCNVQLNPFGCYMISENAPRSTKGIWRKNVLKDWFGIENDQVSKQPSLNGLDSQSLGLAINKNNSNRNSNSNGKYVYSGIKNLGATCYMGSYLQYLFMNLDFRSKFLNIDSSFFCSNEENNTVSKKGVNSGNGSHLCLNSNRCNSSTRSVSTEGESSLSSMIMSNVNLNKEGFRDDNKTAKSDLNNSKYVSEDNNHNFDVIVELQKIFRQMETGNISVVNPLSFAKTLGISTENQEDATEFAVLLLSLLETKIQQLSTYVNKDNGKMTVNEIFNFIPDLFRGTLNYSIECISCNSKTLIEDHFYELRLQILLEKANENKESVNKISNLVSEKRSNKDSHLKLKSKRKKKSQLMLDNSPDKVENPDINSVSNSNSYILRNNNSGHGNLLKLEQAFDNFFNQELLSDENQYMCDKCQCKRDAVKRCLISDFPPYLHVCLQRYFYDSVSKARKKVSIPVDFPQILDLKNYYLTDKSVFSSDKLSDSKSSTPHSFEYEFIGILEHQGQSAMSGHYTASLRDFQYFDDKIRIDLINDGTKTDTNNDSMTNNPINLSKTELNKDSTNEFLSSQSKNKNKNKLLTRVTENSLNSNEIDVNIYNDNNKGDISNEEKIRLEESIESAQGSVLTRKKRKRKSNGLKKSMYNDISAAITGENLTDSKRCKEEINNNIQNETASNTTPFPKVSFMPQTSHSNGLYSNPQQLDLINNYRLAQMLLNNGNVNSVNNNNGVEGNILNTPTPLLATTPIFTSPLTPINAFSALNTLGSNIKNSNLMQDHIQQTQLYNSLVYMNQNSLNKQSQQVIYQPNLFVQQQILSDSNQNYLSLNKDTNTIKLNNCNNEGNSQINTVSERTEENEINKINNLNSHFPEDDSSPTLIKSSQGSTVVMPQSQNSESQNSHYSYTTQILSQDNNIFNRYGSNTNNHILGLEGHKIGIPQGTANYLQYLQFLNNQSNLIGNTGVLERIIGDSESNNYLNQTHNIFQNQDNNNNNNNKFNLVENKFPLINFQDSGKNGLKGGAKNGKCETNIDNTSTRNHKLSNSNYNENKDELSQKSKIRWKWVHFDDTEVHEWSPKFSLNNNSNRMVTRTGYMLIYKRKDWEPKLILSERENDKNGVFNNVNKSKKTSLTEKGVQNGNLNVNTNKNIENNDEDVLIKKLSLLNLRKQNITYLKNVILKPCIDSWKDKWIKRLESCKNDDEKLTKNYLFGSFIAIPSDWWLSYVHGDDLEKILRFETGSFINFWDYSNLYCRHFGDNGDSSDSFLDPFLFWEGKVKFFPPELINGLEECIETENVLLKNYYDSLNFNVGSEYKNNYKLVNTKYLNLYNCICDKCVSSLYSILDISLKQSKVIYEIMKSNTCNEKDVCLISTRMVNSLITKFDLKHIGSNSNISFLRSKSPEMNGNCDNLDEKFNSTENKSKNDHHSIEHDFNWRSIFSDIKRDIQKNQDYIIKHVSLKDEDLCEKINDVSIKTANRTQDWSKDISFGSSKCPHGSFIRSKINPKTAMLVPTRLLDKFILFEEERSKEISSFILSNYTDKNVVISNIYKSYVRYKCTNKLVPCKHCNIRV